MRRRINTTDTDTAISLATSTTFFDDGYWTTTTANLDLLQVGAVHGNSNRTHTIYDVGVMVEYTPSASPPAHQYDWPSAAKANPPQDAAAPANLNPLFYPNPKQPFVQSRWESPTRGNAKATGDAVGTLGPLLTPNPAAPFNRYNQYEWRSPAKPQSKATGEPVARIAPLFTPNPSRPFSQADWFRILIQQKAKVDDVINRLGTVPFNQVLWDSSAPQKKAANVDTVNLLLPLYLPFRPFVNSTETRTFARQAVRSDIIVNLLPLLTIPVVSSPFNQTDWPNPLRRAFAQETLNIPPWRPFFPPTPKPSGGGGGTGSGWDVGLYEKRRRLEQLRALRFATENEERAEIGRYLRELAAGEQPQTVAMTEAGVREMHVDSRIAMMLAKSDHAPMAELRGIVDQVIARVQADLDEEDDMEVILLGML